MNRLWNMFLRVLEFLLTFNWLTQIRLRLKSRSRYVCRGLTRLRIAPSATLLPSKKTNYIGLSLYDGNSQPLLVTTLTAGENSTCDLSGVIFGRGCMISVRPGALLRIGQNSYIGDRGLIAVSKSLEIGADCAISWGITILDDDGHVLENAEPCLPIRIGNHVWIGCNVTVLKGSTIGDGSVVAAGAVVSGQFPEKCLIGGVPAKILRQNIQWTNPGE